MARVRPVRRRRPASQRAREARPPGRRHGARRVRPQSSVGLSRRARYLAGSVRGILVLRLIQTLINCPGTLNPWSTKIVIGLLRRAFILLLRLVFARGPRRRQDVRVTR